MTSEHEIYTTRLDDGTFVAVSIDSPRFCVGAATEAEAKEKARRALRYAIEAAGMVARSEPRKTSVVSPVYDRELLCA